MTGDFPAPSSVPLEPGRPVPTPPRETSGSPCSEGMFWRNLSFFKNVHDLVSDAEILRRRRYGLIEARNGRFHRVLLRPFPKVVSLYELGLHSLLQGVCSERDRCLIYYNAPLACPGYIALRYFSSNKKCSLKTVNAALAALDEIAQIRGALAIVCHASNPRLSDRIMKRYGWTSHCEHLRGRHYIKRF